MPSLSSQAFIPRLPPATRREFFRRSGRALGFFALGRLALTANPLFAQATDAATFRRRILVLVQLVGGNDGLNTVIPFTDDNYYRLRPTLALPRAQVLPISDQLGLHPACAAMHRLIQAGRMAVVHNVGYPQPSRSHFHSTEVWASGRTERDFSLTGWLGRYLDFIAEDPAGFYQTPTGAFLTEEPPLCLRQASSDAACLNLLRPGEGFADSLQRIAAHIAALNPAQIYVLSLGGFDTHSHQANAQEHLLSILSRGMASFQRTLVMHGLEHQVLTLTVSEFGRRAPENESRGTDHGTAAPLFMMGPGFTQPVIGTVPRLEPTRHQDLAHTIDFRQVYATILEDWLGCNAESVLGRTFEKLPLFTGAPAVNEV